MEKCYAADLQQRKLPSDYDSKQGYTDYYVFYCCTKQDYLEWVRSDYTMLPKRRGYDKLNMHFDIVYSINFHYDYLSSRHENYDAESSNSSFVIGLRLNYRVMFQHYLQNNAGTFARHYLDSSIYLYSSFATDA